MAAYGMRQVGRTKDAADSYPDVALSVTALFNVYIVFWWLEVGKRIDFFGTIRLEFIMGAVLGVFALVRYFSRQGESHNRDLVGVMILYLLVLLASQPLAYDFTISWQTYVNRVLKFALLSFFITQFVVSPVTCRYFCFSTLVAFMKIGQEAFWGKISGSMVWYNQGIPRLHGTPETMFGHPNALSGKTLSLLPFLLYSFTYLKKNWLMALVVLQLVFTVNILLFTGSRTGYLSLFVMLFIMLYVSDRKMKMLSVLMLVFITSIDYIPTAYKDRFMSIFTGHELVGRSSEARKNLFFDSLEVFTENPLGIGLYCFPLVQGDAGRNPQETHNLYTQILVETGIQGTVVFLAFLYLLLRKTRRARKGFQLLGERLERLSAQNLGAEQRTIVEEEQSACRFLLFISRGLLIFIVLRLVLGVFGHDLLEIYWWMAAGLSMSLTNILRNMEQHVDALPTDVPDESRT